MGFVGGFAVVDHGASVVGERAGRGLLESLRRYRGPGRNEYPVEVLWGVVLLTIALRHTSIEGCLGELRRNAGLRGLIAIASESGAPKAWNVSRFLEVLGTERHRPEGLPEASSGRKAYEDESGAVVMVVHLAFATLLASRPRRRGSLGTLRLGVVQNALQTGLGP